MEASNQMMYKTQDEAIIYNGKIQQVKSLIEDLTELGLNVDSFKQEINNIENMVSKKIEQSYNTYDDTNSILNTALSFDYSAAIKRLDKIIILLNEEWKDYYVIVNKCNEIKNNLNSIDEMDFDKVVDSLINILELMRASNTINFEIEKDIVDKLYNLIYNVIKLELIYNKSSNLLDAIKSNETDSVYITNLLKKEIKIIKNDKVDQIVSSLQSNGMDPKNLLDKDLIILVSALNEPELIKELLDEYKEDSKELENISNNNDLFKSKLSSYEYSIKDEKKELNKVSKRYKKQIIKTTIKAILVSLCLSGGIIGVKKGAIDKEYNTTITTYDSKTNETSVTNDYITDENNKIVVTEQTPWRQPEFFNDNKYRRDKYIYEVPEEVYELCKDPKDLLNKDFKYQIIPIDYDMEQSSKKPNDFGEKETKYIITTYQKNLTDYKNKLNSINAIMISLITLLALLIIELVYKTLVPNERYKDIKESKNKILEEIEEYKNEIKEINILLNNSNEEEIKLKSILDKEYNLLKTISKTEPEVAKQLKKIKK